MTAPHRASVALALFSLLFLSSVAAGASRDGRSTTHLHFYFHEFFSGPNATTVTLSEPRNGNGAVSNSSTYLWIWIHGRLRLYAPAGCRPVVPSHRPRPGAKSLGVSFSGSVVMTVINFVFTDGPFNGSTLQALGRAILGTEIIERPILSGTGAFRMARGYTLSKIIEFPDNDRLILKYHAYVWH